MQGSEKMNSQEISLPRYKLIYTYGSIRIIGYYTISSYEEEMIIIKCLNDSILISGDTLVITLLSADEIHINGNISAVSFA